MEDNSEKPRAVRQTRVGRSTKQWILDTATDLFNTYGTHTVSLHAIARAMEISPGNLHYHFKTKQQIIRAIIKKKVDDTTFQWMEHDCPSLDQFVILIESMIDSLSISWQRITFFKKELPLLLRHDAQLHEWYNGIKADFKQQLHKALRCTIERTTIFDQKVIDHFEELLCLSWMISENWCSNLEINNQPLTKEMIFKGIELILFVWKPYLNEAANEKINAVITRKRIASLDKSGQAG